jgi:hypothetical protein
MDNQRDYPKFKSLLTSLCETFGKPMSDELLDAWWGALKHVDLPEIQWRVRQYIANANDETKFPRPAQMRPKDQAPPLRGDPNSNPIRDYWRSCVVVDSCAAFGLSIESFEQVLIDNKATLGRALLDLLNEVDAQERRDGRTIGQHRYVQRRAFEIASAYPYLRTEHAQRIALPAAAEIVGDFV